MAISRDFQFHLKNLGVQTLQLRQQLVLLFVFIGLPQKMMSQIAPGWFLVYSFYS